MCTNLLLIGDDMDYAGLLEKVEKGLREVSIPKLQTSEVETAIKATLFSEPMPGSLTRQGLIRAEVSKILSKVSMHTLDDIRGALAYERVYDVNVIRACLPGAITTLERIEKLGNEVKSKISLLQENRDNVLLKWIFVSALDWHVAYGFSEGFAVDLSVSAKHNGASMTSTWRRFMKSLTNRKAVTNRERKRMSEILYAMPRYVRKWAYRILMRDLRVRILDTTARKVWPDILHPCRVQLCANYTTDSIIPRLTYLAPKMDGFRVLVAVSNAKKREGVVRSRSGLEIPHLAFLVDQASRILIRGGLRSGVLDAEATDKEGKSWAKAASAVTTESSAHAKKTIALNVFDLIPLKEFLQGYGKTRRYRRLGRLRQCMEKSPLQEHRNIRMMDIRLARDIQNSAPAKNRRALLMRCYDEYRVLGYEGMIGYDGMAEYQAGDSKRGRELSGLLRFKPFETVDVIITGYFEGKGNLAGTLGGFVCQTKEGVSIRVGGGFKLHERTEFWRVRDTMIHRLIEVERQSGALDIKSRHTNFCRLRPKSDSDMQKFFQPG